MVDVNMNPMPLKIIGKETCLWAKCFFGLSKDQEPKRGPNILWRKESKEIKDFMKVEDGSVHHKNTMGIVWNNELKFQRPSEFTHFKDKVQMSNILLQGLFDEGWCESYGAQWNP